MTARERRAKAQRETEWAARHAKSKTAHAISITPRVRYVMECAQGYLRSPQGVVRPLPQPTFVHLDAALAARAGTCAMWPSAAGRGHVAQASPILLSDALFYEWWLDSTDRAVLQLTDGRLHIDGVTWPCGSVAFWSCRGMRRKPTRDQLWALYDRVTAAPYDALLSNP